METVNSRLKTLRKELKLSQDEFANRLGFSRGVVVNTELGRAEIRSLYLQQVSKEYHASLNWLETGEGEMFEPMDRDAVIASFVGGVLASEPDSFKRRLISALATLSEDDWAVLAKLAEQIVEKKEDQA